MHAYQKDLENVITHDSENQKKNNDNNNHIYDQIGLRTLRIDLKF